ncbi:uncharacterized protein MELLADRAFT_92775 [Melampsora larici-populina 98AG31]|uniref:Uncharacterized protein n=1 Tax=Melampsora larici-populina (strain 98AG31 / pathotype 3-4-7) TaxID=747676 RepID=F4S2P9_MELLP|nr:uncharacterized protein MELLADRAFT_92775 [Melampsora larici-populina 98AG31]EGG01089.1 hypothetical protein MELLADRAFT_92775 [Melampsora larici-populina 98AG31]
MKHIILNSPFSPELKWKASIRRAKNPSKRSVLFRLKMRTFKLKRKRELRRESATKKLIASTSRGGTQDQESEESIKEQELATFANKIFSKFAIERSSGGSGKPGGPGKISTLPWDPTFQYKLTYHAAWVWANGAVVQQTPPGGVVSTDEGIYKKQSLSHSTSMPNMNSGLVKVGEKRVASGSGDMIDIKADLKKIKVEHGELIVRGYPIKTKLALTDTGFFSVQLQSPSFPPMNQSIFPVISRVTGKAIVLVAALSLSSQGLPPLTWWN